MSKSPRLKWTTIRPGVIRAEADHEAYEITKDRPGVHILRRFENRDTPYSDEIDEGTQNEMKETANRDHDIRDDLNPEADYARRDYD